MPDETLKPALRTALRLHEIGDASPYQLFFAGKGKSGASFGFMQGDMAGGQSQVQQTFRDALSAAQIPRDAIESMAKRLSVPLIVNPLDPGETRQVNAALLASRALVDAMDEAILAGVYNSLDTCVAKASGAGRSIDPKGLIFMALWINMTGPPSKLLVWLAGGSPGLSRPVPSPGPIVNGPAMETYLRATDYYVENPGNLPHMLQCAAAGAAMLAQPAAPAATRTAQPPAVAPPALAEKHFTYEQATGRMFLTEAGVNDLFASGYSGSEEHSGKNNPHAQCEQDIGPLPRGIYTIGAPRNGPTPISLPLTPDLGNDMCGRSDFLIHGDLLAAPGTASHGCIILPHPDRERIAATHVDQLLVVDQMT